MTTNLLKKLVLSTIFALGCALVLPANAQVPNACQNPPVTCETLPDSLCDAAGFSVTLQSFTQDQDAGAGVYVYEVCSPAIGHCTIDTNVECLDHDQCTPGPKNFGMCDRACVVDKFHDLSHFNIQFPELGQSCLPANTEITGDCSNGNFDLGDGSCGGTQSQVAKCDNTSLQPGECLTMTLNIPGEETGPGLGVVVSKAGDACVESCMAGPSCEPCEDDDDGDSACLTRTRGFWGTHPHIAENFIPITVCGKELTTTVANVCGTSEALCTNAQDRKDNPPSLTLVAQLTAAKLNLEATEATVNGTCSDWEYDGKSIQEWIDYCEEDFCGASKKDIGKSGCIEALDAFNNSDDTGFEETPAPFDQPGPAQVGECQKARGNGISNYSCVQP